ncbi:hypothetical protein [Vibrio phage pTD1]|uniref:Uncharacterized protein n=1 Tax=Vibrio phage pTD1 TaxID=1938577 RepID=A0A1Q2U338_9CAUD|nr:hypothetical protein FDH33_gp152 [Vibrio phage pTD1]BAW98361.1 hypothetical protein [Vibrio phage pTD1]
MAKPIELVLRALQYVILNMFYYNFKAIVMAGHREITSTNCGSVCLFHAPKSLGGISIHMVRDSKAKYYIEFKNLPYELGPRDVVVKLGTGTHLVNHRVMNDLGVRLNPFLNDSEYRYYMSTLNKYALQYYSEQVTVKTPSYFRRLFGVVETNFDQSFDKANLPGFMGYHYTTWGRLEGESNHVTKVQLYGGISREVK